MVKDISGKIQNGIHGLGFTFRDKTRRDSQADMPMMVA